MEEGPSSSSGVTAATMQPVNPVASDTNARAKTHPLFPVLEYIASQVQEIGKQQRLHSKRLTRMENLIEDQGKLIEKYHRNAFSLKEEHLEDPLRTGAANLFCKSLKREVPSSEIAKLVKTVLKDHGKDAHKVKVAITYVKKKLSNFRIEERRRVLGLSPCQKAGKLTSEGLCEMIMNFLKAHPGNNSIYLNHLIVLRKFIRVEGSKNAAQKMYTNFRKWLKTEYPPNGTLTNAQWEILKKEDSGIEYGEIETEIIDEHDDTGIASDTYGYTSQEDDDEDN